MIVTDVYRASCRRSTGTAASRAILANASECHSGRGGRPSSSTTTLPSDPSYTEPAVRTLIDAGE